MNWWIALWIYSGGFAIFFVLLFINLIREFLRAYRSDRLRARYFCTIEFFMIQFSFSKWTILPKILYWAFGLLLDPLAKGFVFGLIWPFYFIAAEIIGLRELEVL